MRNFRAFKDVKMTHIPNFCIIVGANGTGKSTLFSVFDFLKNAMIGNVNSTLAKLGGKHGFNEVRSRNSSGPIEIELKFREKPNAPLATYFLQIDEQNGKAYVARNPSLTDIALYTPNRLGITFCVMPSMKHTPVKPTADDLSA